MATTARKPSSVRRREIAEAALRVIGEHGATSLTAASLGREVGLTAGALFRHFATLDDILSAAVDVAIEAVDTTFPSDELPPIARLRELALQRIELIGGRPGLAWLLLSDHQVYLCVPEAAVTRLRAVVQRSRAFLLAAFREGVARGDLRADVEPETLLPIFTGTIHSLIVARGIHQHVGSTATSASPERIVDALFALLANP
ncbi:MAG: TetR/AcrR family transcriptional regulator [bacterium]|nr:TetR/AcrR family transcriptional regulator [bacterium]